MAQTPPRAIILGCAGERLSAAERALFAAANPLGFILFRRNCRAPEQVRDLVAAFRECVGRPDAPVLIDQEGGRVVRLQPPHWRRYPSAERLAQLPDPIAEEAVHYGARLIADDLSALGITVDCAPVLDLPAPGADPVIGDRAYGNEPARVARLGRAMCEGLLGGGVLPVLKHIPGHGRARVDSHYASSTIATSEAELAQTDFAPFRALAEMPQGTSSGTPWAMTAHVVLSVIDDENPVTLSSRVIAQIIRGAIGFDGVLVSDDLSMGALAGSLGERVRGALAAGCDLALHCNGVLDEMAQAIAAAAPVSPASLARLARAEKLRRRSSRPFDRTAAEARFDAILGASAGAGTR